MLTDGKVTATLPCSDFERAKTWYKERLGLSPSQEDPLGAEYQCVGGTSFMIFPSSGVANGEHTQIGFEVDDLEAEVAEMRKNGVIFEEYDFPGLKTIDGIADMGPEKAAWFKDSEGNLLAVSHTER